MATTITYNTNTQHSLVAVVASNDGVAVTDTRANVLAACAPGPLKELLTRVTNWTVFNLGGAFCKLIHVREVVECAAAIKTATAEFIWEAQGIKFNCDAGTSLQIEIRLAYSERF